MASAAYLAARYLNGQPPKKKKKKSTKKQDGLRFVQIDEDWDVPTLNKTKIDEPDDDDAPQIVYEEKETKASVIRSQVGTWTKVDSKSKNDDDRPRFASSDDDDLSVPRRPQGRVDSDSDASDLSPPRRAYSDSDEDPPRKQMESKSDGSAAFPLSPQPQQQRLASSDSSDDLSPPRRDKFESSHAAGLLSAESFRETETRLRQERKAILDSTVNEGQGHTIYRDRKGRKLDLEVEQARIQAELEHKKREEQALFELRRGTKQKADEFLALQELEAIKAQPFARTAHDAQLNEHLKSIIYDDDPMADYFRSKDSHVQSSHPLALLDKTESSKSTRPMYKGPPPAPNRFHIAPGYRWDGIDRGNGWELKLLAHQANAVNKQRNLYTRSSAHM
mmetsp:Transcript_1170/g.1423  ORF Transcript_1170/g.1423 Transcript_1170/m.1423 type:complete len:391 (-) Transcript_1170:305-1477(-)|eukprot:CAMPEP_0197322216 /NCGR_PEP_ID=MMETSP0891-20130614/68763_1 /TAXON_ID=44058 ORGANISM="Aureoumbra lagunensis, Strain CCMP1510" /NCGR_SAMPLE_ID=MMETSP0891 /ASSEMBLY_ACC=CAM_ASM_000534 /LENGTH=390 /DNA_ID=CAMNT_0042814495 /DNA_START=44 /DNA_END=1216 /DNA_ORIENTATION=+